ncbi:cytochrome P450 [Schizophyllum commune]
MLDSVNGLDLALGGMAAVLLAALVKRQRQALPLPPGPPSLPLIGGLLSMPSETEWLTFAEWGAKYGDICSVSVFGQTMIIVNAPQIATDLLDRRSAIYSDRPVMAFGGDFVGWSRTTVLLPYGAGHRASRRLMHQVIGTQNAVHKFDEIEESEMRAFLRDLLKKPEDFVEHIRHLTGSIILRISHGYHVQPGNDPFIELANVATEQFAQSTSPGGFLANLVPPLLYLPDWMPGAGFKATGRAWRATLDKMADFPHEFVKSQMSAGTAEPSFTSNFLDEKKEITPEEEFDLKWSAASLHSGGADTTVGSIHALFRFMAINSAVQARAQAELDTVVGPDRLPTMADRPRLPYVNALALEVLRSHVVAPTGVPHRVTEDDVYEGYFIPKGSLVLANLWCVGFMLHDERTYSRPMEFRPERFLATVGHEPEKDPRTICFGFGRRICPGKLLADISLFFACASILSVFEIGRWKEDGIEVTPVEGQTSGTISHPLPFKCSIRPRSAKVAALIHDAQE